MTRKEKLRSRAFKYASARWVYDGDLPKRELAAYGYLEGYKAAMQDMRKAINKPLTLEEESEGASTCTWIAYRAEQFLKPLR